MKEPEKKVVYYSDITDDFAENNIETKEIDTAFKYINNNPIWKIAAFLLYYLCGVPFAWFCIRIVNGTRFVNRRAIRRIKGGYFIYGNHTHWSDAILPYVLTAPKRTYMIANRDAVSIKGLKTIVLMLGTIPIPSGIRQLSQFIEAIVKRCEEGGCIAVYPEATTWPYYNGIRPFPSTSFTYPAKLRVPVVAMATTFRRRKGLLSFMKTPARTVTLSEPIHAGPDMPLREAKVFLHDQVYDFIKGVIRQKGSYEYIRYEKNTDLNASL
jgi:1-acyl-sn-glycerol-3-phosphate acyltransferase